MTVQAHLKWTDGLQFVARAGQGPAVVLDSSDGASGASPMQLVLIGVAGCTAIDVIVILKKERQHVSRFEVMISGEQAEENPRRYTKIAIEYVLHGKAIKPKASGLHNVQDRLVHTLCAIIWFLFDLTLNLGFDFV